MLLSEKELDEMWKKIAWEYVDLLDAKVHKLWSEKREKIIDRITNNLITDIEERETIQLNRMKLRNLVSYEFEDRLINFRCSDFSVGNDYLYTSIYKNLRDSHCDEDYTNFKKTKECYEWTKDWLMEDINESFRDLIRSLDRFLVDRVTSNYEFRYNARDLRL